MSLSRLELLKLIKLVGYTKKQSYNVILEAILGGVLEIGDNNNNSNTDIKILDKYIDNIRNNPVSYTFCYGDGGCDAIAYEEMLDILKTNYREPKLIIYIN